MDFHTCHRAKLLPGGQCDPAVEVHVLSVLCVIRGKVFYARSVAMPIGNQHACNSGRGRHPWRTGPCLCMLHKKTHYPAWCPLAHSPALTPTEPPQHQHQHRPTLPVPLCWLLLFQLIRSMRGGTMGVLSTRNLECV